MEYSTVKVNEVPWISWVTSKTIALSRRGHKEKNACCQFPI